MKQLMGLSCCRRRRRAETQLFVQNSRFKCPIENGLPTEKQALNCFFTLLEEQ